MSHKIAAEIGCNHQGEFETAKKMIRIAATICRADVVKFQKRNPRELLTPEQYNAPHPNPIHSYGETYGTHRNFLEFDVGQHRELMNYCQDLKVTYSTSVWDMTSAREIISLNPKIIKVPSALNLHFEMLRYLAEKYSGQIHLSLGMTSKSEEDEVVQVFEQRGRAGDLVLYACTSGYPVSFRDLCLREITRLMNKFGGHVKAIGFSGHHLGIAADIAAITLGATWVERHFTLDRTWKGTDHAASVEPDGLRRLVRDIHNVSEALTLKPTDVLEIEIPQRKKLKWTPEESET